MLSPGTSTQPARWSSDWVGNFKRGMNNIISWQMGWTALECAEIDPRQASFPGSVLMMSTLIERLNWRAEELRGKAPGPPNAAGPTTFDHET